jgi:hypothetical protein
VKTLKPVGRLALGVTVSAVVIALLIVGPWARDVWKDHQHVVMVKSETPIFAGAGNESCGGTQLTTVQGGATLRVQRIRYWKNCATLNVVLSDGREGYIVSDNRTVQVRPPLELTGISGVEAQFQSVYRRTPTVASSTFQI